MASPEPTNKPSSPSGDHEPQSSKSANNPSIDKIDMTSEGDAVASASTAEHTPFVGASGGVQTDQMALNGTLNPTVAPFASSGASQHTGPDANAQQPTETGTEPPNNIPEEGCKRVTPQVDGWYSYNTNDHTGCSGDCVLPKGPEVPIHKFGRNCSSLSGIVKFSKPDGSTGYLGNFGVKHQDAFATGKVLARYVANRPKHEGLPYLGIMLHLPRHNDDAECPERYGRGQKQNDGSMKYSEALFIEPRLYSDTFDMRTRMLSAQEKQQLFAVMKIAAPKEDVFAIHLVLWDGERSDVYGLNWPFVPRPGETARIYKEEVADFVSAREWTLYMPAHEAHVRTLYGLSEAFAECGWGTSWEQYKIKNRFHIKWEPEELNKCSPAAQKQNGFPAKFGFQSDFPDWTGYYVKHGFGTVQEILALLDWCDKIRVRPIKSQWIHATAEGIKLYAVSVDCPFETISSSRLLQAGEQLDVYLDPVPEPVEQAPADAEEETPQSETVDSDDKTAQESQEFQANHSKEGSEGDSAAPAPVDDGTDDEKPTKAAPVRYCWKATVLDNNAITHPGTLFLSIERPSAVIDGKHQYLDNRPIPSGDEYAVALKDVDIWLDIRESLTTVKTRLNALNLLSDSWIATQPTSRKRRTLKRQGVAQDDDDGREIIVSHLDGDDGNRNEYLQAREEQGIGEFGVERHDDHTAAEVGTQSTPPAVEASVTPANLAPEPSGAVKSAADAIPENKSPFAGIDFSTQRAILMCHSLPTQRVYNFVEGASKEQLENIFRTCTTDEMIYLDKFLPRVPQGLLMIRGAAGVGKTSFSTRILHLQLIRKKIVLTVAATNQATNNICDRTINQLGAAYDDSLVFRFWNDQLEQDIIRAANPKNPQATVDKAIKKYSGNIGYNFSRSLANGVLQLAGVIDTKNSKIIALRDGHKELSHVLEKSPKDRTEEDLKELNGNIRKAISALIANADMIFTTTTLAGHKLMRKFVAKTDVVCVDEAACATELEIVIGWKGDKPLILAADMEQLLPSIFSDGLKDDSGNVVNSFVSQLEVPLMRRLRDADWPYIDLTRQRRMPNGQFDPANYCIYDNIQMAEGININLPQFEWARKAEAWSRTLYRYGSSSKDGAELLTPSAEGLIEPFLVDVRKSYCYTVPGTTSKANTGLAHYTLWYVKSMKESTGATNDMFVIVVPYLQQRAMYTRIILASPDLTGVQVATANSFMGWEKPYVFVDFTAAENLGGKVGFVADRHRIAVCLTRQTQFMVVMADTRCTIVQNEDPDAATTEELQLELDKKYKLDVLKKLWKYFESTKRIVYEDAEKICQPIMVPQKTQDDIFTVEGNIEAARATLSSRRVEVVEESGWGSGGIEMSTASPPTSNQETTTFGSSSLDAGVQSQADIREWGGGTQQWSNPNQPTADVTPLLSTVEESPPEVNSEQLGEDTHTSTDFTSHAPHELPVRESSSADPPAMLPPDTQASNKITPDVPQELHIHESPSAEFPAVLSEEYIEKACETVWNRLVNEGGQETFQVSHFFPLAKCYKALSSKTPGIGNFRDWALEIHEMVFDVGMDIKVALQEYVHSYASNSAPVTGSNRSTSTPVPPPTTTSTDAPVTDSTHSTSTFGSPPTTSSASAYVPDPVSDPSSDSEPIAPKKSSGFAKPIGKASDGKENRKNMKKQRGAFAPQNASSDGLFGDNDGNGNQSSSSPHAQQSAENGGANLAWDSTGSQSQGNGGW